MEETIHRYWKPDTPNLRLTINIAAPQPGQSRINVTVAAEEIPLEPTTDKDSAPATHEDDNDGTVDEILALPPKERRNKLMALLERKPYLVSRVPARYRREAMLVVFVGGAPKRLAHIRNTSRSFYVCRAAVHKDRKFLSHVPLKRRFKLQRLLESEDKLDAKK